MRPAPFTNPARLALLVSLVLAGCDGGGEKKAAKGSEKADPAGATADAASEAPKPEPGTRNYVAPPGKAQTPALIQATLSGNLESVKALLEGGVDANAARDNGLTALHVAAGEGLLEIARILLEKGADTNVRQDAGATPLHLAASTPGRLEMVRLLLEKGADPDAADKKKRTPLMAAVRNGEVESMNVLIDKGANLELQDNDGGTALHAASFFGQKEASAFLLARGAKVNSLDKRQYTPLHYAAGKGNREVADLLIANGADLKLKTEEGGLASELAAFSKHETLAVYLRGLEDAAGAEPPPQAPTPKKRAKKP